MQTASPRSTWLTTIRGVFVPPVGPGLSPKSTSRGNRMRGALLSPRSPAVPARANEGGGRAVPRLGCGVRTNDSENLSSCPVRSSNHGNPPATPLTEMTAKEHGRFHPGAEAVTQRRGSFPRTLCSQVATGPPASVRLYRRNERLSASAKGR